MSSASESRGTGASRSWYIDEVEWIAYRETDDADPVEEGSAETNGVSGHEDSHGGASKAKTGDKGIAKGKVERFIPAPPDAALRKQACPICQEEFKAEYHEGEQEWVYMDAVKVPPVGENGKIYHASCLDELAQDRGGK